MAQRVGWTMSLYNALRQYCYGARRFSCSQGPLQLVESNSGARADFKTAAKFACIAGAGVMLLEGKRDDQEWSVKISKPLRDTLLQFEQECLHMFITLQSGGLYNFPWASNRSPSLQFVSENKVEYPDSNLSLQPQAGTEGCLTRHAIADAAAKAAPGVVNITVTVGIHNLFVGTSSGSGTIIQSDGIILTNAHVVADAGKGPHTGKIVVTLNDGRTFNGEVLSKDMITDIAVVKIMSKTPLPTVKLGSSRNLRAGEWVVAVGSPLHLQNTVTAGIISAVERKSSEIGLHGASTDYIQTDAAINQGNSGGPLLNLDGEAIGINTMKALTADGVSFAIPIDTAVKIMNQLKKHGHVVRPWLGMKMLELTEPIIGQLKDRDKSFPNVQKGVLVPQVIPGSPAERGGIRTGDVIVQFDGKPIESVNQIVEALGDKVGVSFKVVVKRSNDKQATLVVVPEEASPNF